MKNLKNIEVFKIIESDKQIMAYISYQDLDNIDDINNGYNWISVPLNIRDIQLSSYGNILVDQSVKEEPSEAQNV